MAVSASMDEYRREVWEGKIPVCFILSQEELQGMGGGSSVPEPCFMLLPRVSYFALFYDKLEKLYARAVGASIDDKLWLSFGPIPLKWHYPLGVLYDLFGQNCTLPWEITVHFKNYPSEEILIYEGKEALESHFQSKVKEADWLKHSAKVIQQFTPQEFGKLWQGFSQNNYDEFWSVNHKLMLNMKGEVELFKNIPFCVYREGHRIFQRLISSDNTCFKDLIELCHSESDISHNSQFLLHGVELPMDTPLQWLSEHMCYPDNFLHIVAVTTSVRT